MAGWLRYSRQFRAWSAHAAPAWTRSGPQEHLPQLVYGQLTVQCRQQCTWGPARAEQAADGGRGARRDAIHRQVGGRPRAHQAADHVHGQHGRRRPN